MNIKFDFKNKKNMMTVGVFVLALLLLFQFIYFPKHREVKRLSAEYKEVVGEISALYDFIGGQDNLEENIVRIRKELALLENAFPFEKEIANIIKQLNEEAEYFNVSVSSLKPRNPFIYKDHGGSELKISNYFCKCMPLTLNVEGRYQALGEFIKSLEVNRDPMITIEEIDIENDEKITPKIKAEIELNAFMLGR